MSSSVVIDSLLIFLRRKDKLDILKRFGFWRGSNIGRALLSLVRWPGGAPRLRVAPWPQGNYFVLGPRMGFYRHQQVVRDGAAPCVKAIRVDLLQHLLDRNRVLPPGAVEWLAKPGHFLLLDMSGESLEPVEDNAAFDRLARLHDLLDAAGVATERVILLTANAAAIASERQWRKSRGRAPGIHVLGYHFYLFEMHFETLCNPWFARGRHVRDLAERTVLTGELRPHHFMSLNLKDRPHRFALLLHLIDRGYLDKGLVSYFADGQNAPAKPPDDEQMGFLARLPSAERLMPHIPELLRRRPIALGGVTSDPREENWGRQISGSYSWMIPELKLQGGDLVHYLSYFEIVTETYSSAGEALYITEKTLRPIVRLQPFVLIGPPFLLRELRRLGFKTFSPWIDESYDDIADPVARIEAAFREIDRLCVLPLAELHRVYCEIWPVLAHNFDRYTDYSAMRRLYDDETAAYVIRPLLRICAGERVVAPDPAGAAAWDAAGV